MALVFRFPTYHPCSYYNRSPRGYDFFHDLWREIALPYEQQAKEKSHQGSIEIAFVPLGEYKPEEISLEVDSDKVILHGQHRFEREDGFEESKFKKVFKIPQSVDPKTVKSRTNPNRSALVIEGTRHQEEKSKDGKFQAKLDFSGFKPEEINIQLTGSELTVTGKHVSEGDDIYLSRDYSRRILLPDDVIITSVRSRLSKEGLLTIEASRDPALLPLERSVDVTMETDEADEEVHEEPKQTTGADAEETSN